MACAGEEGSSCLGLLCARQLSTPTQAPCTHQTRAYRRVNGNLNLSRAIGDLKYKGNTELHPKDQIITAQPDIRHISLQPEDRFFVLACDGVWDVMTNQVRATVRHAGLHSCKLSPTCTQHTPPRVMANWNPCVGCGGLYWCKAGCGHEPDSRCKRAAGRVPCQRPQGGARRGLRQHDLPGGAAQAQRRQCWGRGRGRGRSDRWGSTNGSVRGRTPQPCTATIFWVT